MTINELIYMLQILEEERGDVDIKIYDYLTEPHEGAVTVEGVAIDEDGDGSAVLLLTTSLG